MLSDFPNRFIDIVKQIEKNIPNEFEKMVIFCVIRLKISSLNNNFCL